MKIKGIKRGQIIELLESINIPNGVEITEVPSPYLNSLISAKSLRLESAMATRTAFGIAPLQQVLLNCYR